MTPEIAAYRMSCALTLGAVLGVLYGFLRPLRPRHTLPADGIFLAAAAWTWIYLGFGICGGDIRVGYVVGLLAGGFVWESTVGRWLRPVFTGFWKGLEKLFQLFSLPVKKLPQ